MTAMWDGTAVILLMVVLLISQGISADAECEHVFNSADGKTGTFTSPGYPEPYSPATECVYSFHGSEAERVQITITDIDLTYTDGDPADPWDCEQVDYLSVFNGPHGTTQVTSNSLIGNYCGRRQPPSMMSDSSQLTVEFVSLEGPQGVAKGFQATYTFVTDFEVNHTGIQAGDVECGFIFLSGETKKGTFTSPNFPGLYPRNTQCHYFFFSAPGEVVFIKFPSFDVEGIPPLCDRSTMSDSVTVSETPIGQPDRLERRFCGNIGSEPSAVSEEDFLHVTFTSNNVYDDFGFNATYEFVPLL